MKMKKSRLEMMEYELQESSKSVTHMETLLHGLRLKQAELEHQLEKQQLSTCLQVDGGFSGRSLLEKSLLDRCQNLEKTINELHGSIDSMRMQIIEKKKAINCLVQADIRQKQRCMSSRRRRAGVSLRMPRTIG